VCCDSTLHVLSEIRQFFSLSPRQNTCGAQIGLLSLTLSVSQVASLGEFLLAPACPIEKVTLWEGFLYLTLGSEILKYRNWFLQFNWPKSVHLRLSFNDAAFLSSSHLSRINFVLGSVIHRRLTEDSKLLSEGGRCTKVFERPIHTCPKLGHAPRNPYTPHATHAG